LGEQGELKPLSTSPEQQGSSISSKPSNLQPIMSILGGVTTALILVTVVIVVTMRLRCGREQRNNHGGINGSSHPDQTWKTDSGENSSADLQAATMDGLLQQQSPGNQSINQSINQSEFTRPPPTKLYRRNISTVPTKLVNIVRCANHAEGLVYPNFFGLFSRFSGRGTH
jgi:hypothetical protein